jgi:hypothetical protein
MMTNCSCCNDLLLRHIRRGQVAWFCRTCWQYMPDLESIVGLQHKPVTKHLKKSLKVLQSNSAMKFKAMKLQGLDQLPA